MNTERPGSPRAAVKSHRNPHRPVARDRAPARTGSTRWVLFGIVALVGLSVVAVVKQVSKEEHYATARVIIEDYERAKSEEMINYANPAYDRALAELAKIDRDSKEAALADQLALDIATKKEAFERRQRAMAARERQGRETRKTRHLDYLAHSQNSMLNPVTEYPECEEEHDDHEDD